MRIRTQPQMADEVDVDSINEYDGYIIVGFIDGNAVALVATDYTSHLWKWLALKDLLIANSYDGGNGYKTIASAIREQMSVNQATFEAFLDWPSAFAWLIQKQQELIG